MKKGNNIFFIIMLFFMTSCGYRWQENSLSKNGYKTVYVPYVLNDEDGYFTAELIRALNVNSLDLSYQNFNADLSLKIILKDLEDNQIDYYYNKDSKDFPNQVIPSQSRLKICAEVTIIDNLNDKEVCPNFRVCAEVDFDYIFDPAKDNLRDFSKGELESYSIAKDQAMNALYKKIALNIVEYINSL